MYSAKHLFFFLAALTAIVVGVWLAKSRPETVNTLLQASRQKAESLAVATSPYDELTIPTLRERTYESSLGQRSEYASYATHTSYLTSYTSDGLKINGLLTIPAGEMPEGGWPAIVFVHGYIPPTLYETTSRYVDYVDSLARSGFVVFKIDLRGHGESEGTPGGAYYSADYVIDTLNARAALAGSGVVHPQKIGLWGHSMAGNVVLRATAVRPEIPATVIWAGAVYTYEDMLRYRITDNSYRPPVTTTPRAFSRQRLYESVGSPSATSPFWKSIAPANYVDEFQGAVEIHHAVDDDVVNVGYSRDLATILNEAGTEYEYFEYPSGGHNIDGASFAQAMQRTIDFYRRHL